MPGPANNQFVQSWRRWPLLFLYVNCNLCIGSISLCFSPASKEIASAYNTSIVDVNMSYMIGSITGIPMTFVCIYLYRTFPSHWVLRLACCNALIGGWFRRLSNGDDRYWPIIVGTSVLSLSAPLFFVQMTKFCNRWFSDSERTIATVICALTIPAGNLVAFILSGVIFRGIEL